MAYRFTRRQRLLKTDEFSSVFSLRKSFSNAYFQLNYMPNQLGHARMGLVVSKKVAKQAVRRNRIKRQAREVFRLQAATLPPYDLIVRAKQAFFRANANEAREALMRLLQRLPPCRAC